MKQIFLICATAALLAATSCSKQDGSQTDRAVRFRIVGIGEQSKAATNYVATDYFTLSNLGKASVELKSKTTTYVYANDILQGETPEDCHYFPVDNSALASIKVRWPDDAARSTQGTSIAKDQSSKEVFLAADWLSATLQNVTPAQTIALTLSHERAKVTFTLVGANADKKITALSIGGYTAFCDEEASVKDAQLILTPGSTDIKANAIGALSLEGESTQHSFVISTMPTLVAGENHTIEINL